MSPAMFDEFVIPFLKKQVDAFKAEGAYTVKHTDGNIMPILDSLISTGITALHSLDPMAGVDIKKVREIVGNKLCLIGNVNCALMHAGKPEEVEESARYCLQYGGAKTGGYIFSTSNCIFDGVPLGNYMAMLEARKKWGNQDVMI